MTEYEIRSKINYYDGKIDECIDEMNKLDDQLEELGLLKNKFIRLQENFASKQSQRKNAIKRNSSAGISNKIFKNYLSGMTGLLNGSQYNSAYNGLTTAKGKVDSEIKDLTNQYTNCENTLRDSRDKKSYWQQQLRLKLAEENE